jgi:DNA end-binding protein Ku
VVDLMEALRRSVGGGGSEPKAPKKSAKKSRKAPAGGQKEMLMPISGKKPAKETPAKKTSRQQRKSA